MENNLKEKILSQVKKIKKGEVKSYKQIAKLAGKEKAFRYVANLMAKNRSSEIPCHRVVKNDLIIGGYFGSEKNSWKKLALLLKEGNVVVMPTDTIYGICASSLDKKSVEKVYKLRKRNPKKPCIILISSLDDLKTFGVEPTKKEFEFLKKVWPGKVSVILKIKDKNKLKKFKYLHRGIGTLAFRLPKSSFLAKVLKISGPLIAPSANIEGEKPAETINQARKYFGDKVLYYDAGRKKGKPSKLIKIVKGKIEVLRK
ncbi:Putative threonylcarbamoyl-AMP synthase [bacterium HR34]|nr:Putative threonylcarbamoyl-AMP synthase [bacterium HR34]